MDGWINKIHERTKMQVKEVRGHVGVLKNNRRHGLNAGLNCLTLTHQTVIRVGFLHRTTFEFYNSLLFCVKSLISVRISWW